MQKIQYFTLMTITGNFLTIIAPMTEVQSPDFWTDFASIATDPAHLLFEFLFSIVFDFIIVTILYGVVIRKILIPRLKKSLHDELDAEHGVEHPKDSHLE